MNRNFPRLVLVGLVLAVTCAMAAGPGAESPQSHKAAAPVKKAAQGGAGPQSARNIGRAYYEQGKYPEATAEFQKVIASGHAIATDHLNLGLSLMQGNKLDEALGELTTAKQMDPKLVAAEYNLGILYKRELRYPDAEAAFKAVIAADPEDPAAWFNLGTVYFAERKLEDALAAHKHVVGMGFGQGQNFYVASPCGSSAMRKRTKFLRFTRRCGTRSQVFRCRIPPLREGSTARFSFPACRRLNPAGRRLWPR
jgi:hypothetical protein